MTFQMQRSPAATDESRLTERSGSHWRAIRIDGTVDEDFEFSDEEDLFGDIEALLEDFDSDLMDKPVVETESQPAPEPQPIPWSRSSRFVEH